ncbi:hypothetical protein [Legionella sp. km772]|uniref:hypothetical protein n=1 Tax=Legionella sp. km772 TaxID=2498111 RepID=UPI000F8D494B|nr:hypothetical protein [Legionella sp. km772]RUR10837.1 hypothetical protein ELY15_07630 [Legionella sp. km772]
MTSDLQEDVIGPLCQEKKIPINLAINALRVRKEAEERGLESASMTDLEREKLEVEKLFAFSEKYGVKVYYKSDSPGLMKEYVHDLELRSEVERRLLERGGSYSLRFMDPVKKRSDIHDTLLQITEGSRFNYQ